MEQGYTQDVQSKVNRRGIWWECLHLCPVSQQLWLCWPRQTRFWGDPTRSGEPIPQRTLPPFVVLYYPIVVSHTTWDSRLYSELEHLFGVLPSIPLIAQGFCGKWSGWVAKETCYFWIPAPLKMCQLTPKGCWIDFSNTLTPIWKVQICLFPMLIWKASFRNKPRDRDPSFFPSGASAQKNREKTQRDEGTRAPGFPGRRRHPMAESEGFSNFGIESKFLSPVPWPQWWGESKKTSTYPWSIPQESLNPQMKGIPS